MMQKSPAQSGAAPVDAWRRNGSRAATALALLVVAGTFLLISPPGGSFPGAIPWGRLSILRGMVDLMSLNGLLVSVRGSEIKDFVFQLGVAAALLLLAIRLAVVGRGGEVRARLGDFKSPWAYAQLFLVGWALISALSAAWSDEPALALGQAALFGFGVVWAIALAWLLQREEIRRLLAGIVAISVAGAVLCIWYYYERNPHHRPGFPLGNPTVLAPAILPAMLISLCTVAAAVWRAPGAEPSRRSVSSRAALGAALALVPLVWCFALADSRGAVFGLAVGVALIILVCVLNVAGQRRWVLIAAVAAAMVLGAGLWYWYSTRFVTAMARGETIRFRLYAWRYAAELWQQRPFLGHGAGAYPRLAGQFSVRDRALDPGAFMGEIIGHAHNELFEVFSEIGLIAGLTYVAAFVATFLGAIALARRNPGDGEFWPPLALAACVAALLSDGLFGVALRLPGVPALFATLLGALWAMSRAVQAKTAPRVGLDALVAEMAGPKPAPPQQRYGFIFLAAASIVLASAAGWIALRNWLGVQAEYASVRAELSGDDVGALRAIEFARKRLLDPVRVLAADERVVSLRRDLARSAYQASVSASLPADSRPVDAGVDAEPGPTRPGPDTFDAAVGAATAAFDAAENLAARIPRMARADAYAAQAAELLAALYQTIDAAESQRWHQVARQAWLRQSLNTPYDFETLLALTGHATSPVEYLTRLRDALRVTDARGPWREQLARVANDPAFGDAVELFLGAAGPIDPQTDLDSLVFSMAPEVYRLAAARDAVRGEFDSAQRRAARAVELYRPMRPRFPLAYSWALSEQAEYLLKASLENAPRAAALLREAIAALPEIQQQKYEEMVTPYRRWLVACLLAAGDEHGAAEALRAGHVIDSEAPRWLAGGYLFLVDLFRATDVAASLRTWLEAATRCDPGSIRAWYDLLRFVAETRDADGKRDRAAIEDVLARAAEAGVPADGVRWMRERLGRELPDLRDSLERP